MSDNLTYRVEGPTIIAECDSATHAVTIARLLSVEWHREVWVAAVPTDSDTFLASRSVSFTDGHLTMVADWDSEDRKAFMHMAVYSQITQEWF